MHEKEPQADPFTQLAVETIKRAMNGVEDGNVSDAYWLMSDESETFLDLLETKRATILRRMVKTMLGELKTIR